MVWVYFLLCSIILVFFSDKLCKEGMELSGKTGISAGMIGALFLAIATSFPEISTAVSSVIIFKKISLGYGDIVGSIAVNFMILLGLDYLSGKQRILCFVSRDNRMTGNLLLASTATVFLASYLRSRIYIDLPVLGNFSIENVFFIIMYLFALRYSAGEAGHVADRNNKCKEGFGQDFARLWLPFAGLLFIVIVCGIFLAKIGAEIARATTLSETFIGMIFLGFVTSLPEIIVSVSALRAGSVDMAIGNILGSNLFDICIIPLLDIAVKGPILGKLSVPEIISGAMVLVMAFIFSVAVLVKKRARSRVNVDTGLIFVVGLISFMLIYTLK